MTLSVLRHPPFNRLLKARSRNERERPMLHTLVKVDNFPESMIFEILSWLCVKDILRFKSVCKSWYAIISSSTFISKHLKNNYIKNDVDCQRCFLVHCTTPIEVDLCELLVDETPRVLDYDYYSPLRGSYVYGPCDGLYYVTHYHECGLWNPAMNQFHLLPKIIDKPDLPPLFTSCYLNAYGFGLDPFTGDYKVVVIQVYNNTDLDSDVELAPSVFVYSLRSDSWRFCGDLGKCYDVHRNTCYIYVNGCCYWFGSYGCSWGVIISFDFATDAYAEIPVPDYPTDSYRELREHHYCQPNSKCLGVYDDLLAFMCFQENEQIIDIWTWEKERSWTKKLSAGPFPNVCDPIFYWKGNKIILTKCYWKSKCVVKELVLFDPQTQEVRDFGFKWDWGCDGVFSYMESLVSIKRCLSASSLMKQKQRIT